MFKKNRVFSLSVIIITMLLQWNALFAETIRKPVFAGGFYPDNAEQIKKVIKLFRQKVDSAPLKKYSKKDLKALIMPHAGYVYSGQTAAYGTFLLDGRSYKKVIMMGPDHTTGFAGSVINCADYWETPLGRLNVHGDAKKTAAGYSFFQSMGKTFLKEHSIEVILPFLQYSLKSFSLVPVIVGGADIVKTAKAIEKIVDDDTLVVASSDLSHYLTYDQANKKDAVTIKTILKLDYSSLLNIQNTACGRYPSGILMRIAEKKGWEPVLIHYSNSGDASGELNRVVGYCTIAFFKENKKTGDYTEEEGKTLVKLARLTIAKQLGLDIDRKEFNTVEMRLKDPVFHKKRGTFVTLNKHDMLRGCIGNISPDDTVFNGVMKNALNAAFKDPRFSGLTKKEFELIDIEVSILTTPEELEYKGVNDLLSKLRPHVDGLIIRKGFRSATFLPQVWDQIPNPAEFLSYLCRKAGLSEDEWRTGELTIMRYQVQYFEE